WNAYYQYGINKTALRVIANTLLSGPPNPAGGAALPGRVDLASDAVVVTPPNITTGLTFGSIACRSVTADPSVSAAVRTIAAGCKPLDVFGTGVADPHAIAWTNSINNIDRE